MFAITRHTSHITRHTSHTTHFTHEIRAIFSRVCKEEEELLKWTNKRGSTVVAVGADVPGAAMSLRYEGDDNDDVRLLTETLVAELLAASLWRSQSS